MTEILDGARIRHATPADIESRILFHADIETLEIDLSGVHFVTSAGVNAFHDRIEERIADQQEDLWFFLWNHTGLRIEHAAWFAFSRRGTTLDHAHSMGSVRFDDSDETRRQIVHNKGTEAEDPNLFADRTGALIRIAELPSRRWRKIVHVPNYTRPDFEPRLTFFPEEQVMEVDFSDFTFHHARDVDDFYDFVEAAIIRTDRKWYFLVRLDNCRIEPEAWVQYARRGKRVNEAASLGSVRYAAGSETEADIRLRAESQGFRPNIRNTREEALDRIAEMKGDAATG